MTRPSSKYARLEVMCVPHRTSVTPNDFKGRFESQGEYSKILKQLNL